MSHYIPQGVSLRGVQLLGRHQGKVSLRDLKRFDPTGMHPEITRLKRIANAIPFQKYEDKILNVQEFVTYPQYGVPWQEWKENPFHFELIWPHITMERSTSPFYGGDAMIFGIPKETLLEIGACTITPEFIDNMLGAQVDLVNEYPDRQPVHKLVDNMIFGICEYKIVGDVVQIKAVQSSWENNKVTNRKQKGLTAMCLIECVRHLTNDGYRKFEMLKPQGRIEELQDPNHFFAQFPHEVYSLMPRKLGFRDLGSKLILNID